MSNTGLLAATVIDEDPFIDDDEEEEDVILDTLDESAADQSLDETVIEEEIEM